MLGRLAALGLGLGLVALVEVGLRLVPALDPPPFTLELARADGRALHAINPAYARRFFAGVAGDVALRGIRMTPRPYIEPAPEGALRVLFAGGSTVQGYPHPKRLAASSFLQEMLGDLWPERRIEVFNAGITAASSFAVARAVADGVEALSADLVVVYTGHNELYGVYGAASLAQGGQGVWSKRAHYALMQWRLTGLVGRLLGALRAERAPPPADLIAVMARAGYVAAADERRGRAAENLADNLRAIAEFCRERGVPLVLCTLASNERGFAPARGAAPIADAERWAALLAAGERNREPHKALAALAEARALADEDAYVHFLRGVHLERLGQGREAQAAYVRARELDLRPWRATDTLNEIVRRVAVQEGAFLADVSARLRAESPSAGIGWELMADHLHPAAPGQVLLAWSVVAALKSAPVPWELPADWQSRLAGPDDYRQRLGDLPVERLAVLRAMAALFAAPPMDQGNEGRVRALEQAAAAAWAGLSGGERTGVERWSKGEGPNLLPLNVADALFATGDYALARDYYRAANLEEPYTVWGDLWGTLRRLRAAKLVGDTVDVGELDALQERMHLLAQAPDFTEGLGDFFSGYALHLRGDGSGALAALESAVRDPGIRRTFFADLLELLAAELVAADRWADAEHYVAQVAAEQRRVPFGHQLIERLRVGRSPR